MYLVDLPIGAKPYVVVSEDGINLGLGQPIAARVTTNPRDREIRTAVELDDRLTGLDEISYVLCHDLATFEGSDFMAQLGRVPYDKMVEIERKLRLALRIE